jgi:voltage-gated potassium channel
MEAAYGPAFDSIEAVTVAFFAVDYALRLFTANNLYPDLPEGRSLARYVFSFSGIIDLLSFLPYYLPFFFPTGAVVFRLFRIARIFRLFRINAYYDSLNVITEVIISKRQQLLSSVFIISVLMLASSLCMYSLEHEAQPEVFQNAFSGVWWSVSTLLTVGYGDIYPITPVGQVMAIVIAFLGVGVVAIPTGIISAGFVEQYGRAQNSASALEISIQNVIVDIDSQWLGLSAQEVEENYGIIIVMVRRGGILLQPNEDYRVAMKDVLAVYAKGGKLV